jgi:WD40 repeat protein
MGSDHVRCGAVVLYKWGSMNFHGCSEYIASLSWDQTVRIWSAKDGSCLKVLGGWKFHGGVRSNRCEEHRWSSCS